MALTRPEDTTAAGYFGAMADSYDSFIRRAVPRYDEMTARLLDYLPARATRVLELGCGTGNLSLRLAAKYPDAEITFVDAAPEMLDTTRTRLRLQLRLGEGEGVPAMSRARFVCARFEELALPSGFDVVTSSISLHHVSDETKPRVYAAIYALLAPGGTFRFSDQLRGGTAANHELNWTRWLEFCREPGHADAAEIQSLLDHAAAHDHYLSLADHFRLLAGAGFVGLDCVWRNWIWGIVSAERP